MIANNLAVSNGTGHQDARTRFTVVIPTRERAATLRWTLRSCLDQDYSDFEVLVSDNHSQDGTPAVVDSLACSRLRYVNTGHRVSMTENWEFALSHVATGKGGFVTYLGDDDALLPGALRALDDLLRHTGSPVIAWKRAPYFWPDYYDETLRNGLFIPLRDTVEPRDGASTIREVIAYRRGYAELPMVYSSVVNMDVIDLGRNQAGRYFNAIAPDIYSGFVIASQVSRYHYSQRPYTIEGASRTSTGSSLFFTAPEAQEAARQFAGENDIAYHQRLVDCSSLSILVAETFLQAQSHVKALGDYSLEIEDVLRAAMAGEAHSEPDRYAQVAEAVVETGRRNGVEAAANQIVAASRNSPRPPVRAVPGINVAQRRLCVDCTAFDVTNVYEAAMLCRHLLGMHSSRLLSTSGVLRATVGQIRRQAARRLARA